MSQPTNVIPAVIQPASVDLPTEFFQTTKKQPVVETPEPTEAQVQEFETEKKQLAKRIPHLLFNDPDPDAKPETPKTSKAAAPKTEEAKPEPTPAEPTPSAAEPTSVDDSDAKPGLRRPTAEPTPTAPLPVDIGQQVTDALKPMVDKLTAATPAPAQDDDFISQLSPEDAEVVESYALLEQEFPDKYKGIKSKQLAFMRSLDAYKTKWEKANPDAEWNPDDDVHERFFRINQPSVSETDIHKAQIRVEAKKLIAEQDKTYREKLEKVEDEALSARLQPEIAQAANQVVNDLVETLDPEIKSALKDKGTKAFAETDPVAYEVLHNQATELQMQVSELRQIVKRPRYLDLANPVHLSLAQELISYEEEVASLPRAQQIWNGKAFLPRQQYEQLPPAKRSGYWAIEEADLVKRLVQKASVGVKQKINTERDKISAYAAKYGYVRSGVVPPSTHGAKPAASASAPPVAPTTPPPSGGDGGALPPTTGANSKPAESIQDVLLKHLF